MSAKPELFYRQARFLTSAETLEQCPPDHGYEIAFAGRSNAGKSSAINTLTDQKTLARTSKTPGRTQLINFFQLDEARRLVDLPGYGYAKVSASQQAKWQKHLNRYLEKRRCLCGVVLLMDIRHPLQAFDRMVVDWSTHSGMPLHILLTKCDKLSRQQVTQACRDVEKSLEKHKNISVQPFSATAKTGLPGFMALLDQWLQRAAPSLPTPNPDEA